jgi:tetratricopeptide (TPR) repeat protein
MTGSDAVEQGREAFAQHAWSSAYALLQAADEAAPLDVDDLDALGTAAYLIGDETTAIRTWTRAFNASARADDVERAGRTAFHLVMALLQQGEMAQVGGWLARAQTLLEGHDSDCVERGYLLLPVALRYVEEGQVDAALETFTGALDVGLRFRDPDLTTLGRLGRGRCLLALGQRAEGMALLDEVMLAVTVAEVSPMVAGVAYCAVIDACHEVFDVRRAQEWTNALTRWCVSQPDLVAFQGECLVLRAELMQLHGAWEDALEEAQRAREQLSRAPSNEGMGGDMFGFGEVLSLVCVLDMVLV